MIIQTVQKILNDGIAGLGSDATVVVSVTRHHDVPFLSPLLPPAAERTFMKTQHIQLPPSIPILDKPVIIPPIAAITHGQHTVIKLGFRALRLIVDSTMIQLQVGHTGPICIITIIPL